MRTRVLQALRQGLAAAQKGGEVLGAAPQQWHAVPCSHGAAGLVLHQQATSAAAATAAQQQQQLTQHLSSRAFASLAWRLQQQLQQLQYSPSSHLLPQLLKPSALSAGLPANPLPLLHQQMQQPSHHHQQQQLLQLGGVRTFVMIPRRIKYRKAHKSVGFNETIAPNTRQLAFGLYGIRAMDHCRMPASTIEAVRRVLRRTLKKSTMLWIRITPNVPVTSKPAEVRMGKGKGSLDYWAAPIRPGQILFEMDRCSKTTAMEAMRSIKAKMPIKIGFVEWN